MYKEIEHTPGRVTLTYTGYSVLTCPPHSICMNRDNLEKSQARVKAAEGLK